jgi:hypothetical protein
MSTAAHTLWRCSRRRLTMSGYSPIHLARWLKMHDKLNGQVTAFLEASSHQGSNEPLTLRCLEAEGCVLMTAFLFCEPRSSQARDISPSGSSLGLRNLRGRLEMGTRLKVEANLKRFCLLG